MDIGIAGLWHTGNVIAACLASAGFTVTAYDENAENIDALRQSRPPIFEPGLEEALRKGVASSHLNFTADPKALSHVDILWITYDTPVDHNGMPDADPVLQKIQALIPFLKANTLVLISSQLPLGSSKKLQNKKISLAYSPENLRLGDALRVFQQQDSVVIGLERDEDKPRLEKLMQPFTQRIVWMSLPSAEMTKHAINTFLAMSVAYTNELACLCERMGSDPNEVAQGLKSDPRVGPRAYVRAGGAFAGGTLARDIHYLTQIAESQHVEIPLIRSILESNAHHQQWTQRKLKETLGTFSQKKIALLGLTYKPHTSTLRGSHALALAEWLTQQGAAVHAYDPQIPILPAEYAIPLSLTASAEDACRNAEAIVVTTEWPEFSDLPFSQWAETSVILDPNRFIEKKIDEKLKSRYFFVGKS